MDVTKARIRRTFFKASERRWSMSFGRDFACGMRGRRGNARGLTLIRAGAPMQIHGYAYTDQRARRAQHHLGAGGKEDPSAPRKSGGKLHPRCEVVA